MKQLILLLAIALSGQVFILAPNDSIYQSWWKSKESSIFSTIDSGQFYGNSTGYLQLNVNGKKLILDFQNTRTVLSIEKDPNEVYDNSTKKYSTHTTSGKTLLTYETYALANILTVVLNEEPFRIGTIDGACDMPIPGMTFNYCNETNIEYLTLFVTKPLELTTTREIMKERKINYPEAKKIAKRVTLLPGSTLIMTIKK
jgi:hypothetical protein